MARILLACGASFVLYIAAFAFVLDRPLSLGAIRGRIESGIALGDTIHQPKLVILAGSNGPYSHRCETIGTLIGRPCVNGGIAVGVGLDYLFSRWRSVLRAGDIVYMPLEETQYSRSRIATELGPDAAIMLRHDRATLWSMPIGRQLAALFVGDLRAAVGSMTESAVAAVSQPALLTEGGYNSLGDHVGHTAERAVRNHTILAGIKPFHPTAAAIAEGYGASLVAAFLHWASAHDVRVVGGVPTGFVDSPIEDDALAAIRTIFVQNGAAFLETSTGSRYPRSDFYDTQDHLNEAAQIRHSIQVAAALNRLIDIPPQR